MIHTTQESLVALGIIIFIFTVISVASALLHGKREKEYFLQ